MAAILLEKQPFFFVEDALHDLVFWSDAAVIASCASTVALSLPGDSSFGLERGMLGLFEGVCHLIRQTCFFLLDRLQIVVDPADRVQLLQHAFLRLLTAEHVLALSQTAA